MWRSGNKGQMMTVEAVISAALLLIFVWNFYSVPDKPGNVWDDKNMVHSYLKTLDENGVLKETTAEEDAGEIEEKFNQKFPALFNFSVSLTVVDEYEGNDNISFSIPEDFKVEYGILTTQESSSSSTAELNGEELNLDERVIAIESSNFNRNNVFNITNLEYELMVYRTDSSGRKPSSQDIKVVSYFLSGEKPGMKPSEVRVHFW